MKESSRRWIEAGKTLSEAPNAKVPCPVCGQADLSVTDGAASGTPPVFDRYMRCPACGATEVIVRMRKASAATD